MGIERNTNLPQFGNKFVGFVWCFSRLLFFFQKEKYLDAVQNAFMPHDETAPVYSFCRNLGCGAWHQLMAGIWPCFEQLVEANSSSFSSNHLYVACTSLTDCACLWEAGTDRDEAAWARKGAGSLSMGHSNHVCLSGHLSPSHLSPQFSEQFSFCW